MSETHTAAPNSQNIVLKLVREPQRAPGSVKSPLHISWLSFLLLVQGVLRIPPDPPGDVQGGSTLRIQGRPPPPPECKCKVLPAVGFFADRLGQLGVTR